MKTKPRLILIGMLLLVGSCDCNGSPGGTAPTLSCTTQGSHSLFVALFDGDTPGSLPAPTAPLHYGPPGAALDVQGPAGTALVVNSSALSSNALQLQRGQPDATVVDASVGDIGEAPYQTGTYVVRFTAHGLTVPEEDIAGAWVGVLDSDEDSALGLKLFDGMYHVLEGGSPVALPGPYDPSAPHVVHIEVDMDQREFGVCVDGTVLTQNRAFADAAFGDVAMVRFWIPPTILEAFVNQLVIDEVRVTQR